MRQDPYERQLQQSYKALTRLISDILYRHDPEGMGATVFAPKGEYEPIAGRIVSGLYECQTRADARALVDSIYPNANDKMIREIVVCWCSFFDAVPRRFDEM